MLRYFPSMFMSAPGRPRRSRGALITLLLLGASPAVLRAQAPVSYHVTFPEPEHRWAQVEVVFADVPEGVLQVRMSRTSPGRYALHEFAKNVYDVRVVDGAGRTVTVDQPNLHQWDVAGHDGTVRIAYRVFGDRTDGTYLAIDTTHAHMNIPATLMWARGLERRPARVRFDPPPGSGWRVATQLMPTDDPWVFTAPNLQYLLDSPTELADFTWRTFRISPGADAPTFRIALHHDGSDADADTYARDTEAIVREAEAVFGELPAFDGNTYTFLADYLPYVSGDGMEHRNSTVLSSTGRLRDSERRSGLLGTVAHEFFHAWNVERIRPRTLEPFDFEAANVSDELWLAEGFTSYYGALLMHRAGLTSLNRTIAGFASTINTVTLSPGRQYRSAVDMSRQAPFVDAARSVDRTAQANTFISYYTWGYAIGLGLDLTLRDRTDGRVTLDDYMRALWTTHGRPGGEPGYVDRPYTVADARDRLADVSGDRAFATDFFGRYIEGREVVDYERLLARAGFSMRPRNRDRAWVGQANWEFDAHGATLAAPAPHGSPIYEAGIEQDDELISLDGESIASASRLDAVLARHRPGDRVPVSFVRRGERVDGFITLDADPRIEIVDAGLDADTRAFRDAWLGSRAMVTR